MCGIAMIIGQSAIPAKESMSLMLRRMKHRGPDGNGIWQSKNSPVTLGHVRLAIQDLSNAGAQPMHLDNRWHSIVNGEIYNYPFLRNELEKRYRAQFRSNCDSEVILHGYKYEGLKFFARLNGMFSIALFDDFSGQTHLIRDRLGIKPLYYMLHKNQFILASEIKSIFGAVSEKKWHIDEIGLSQFMTYQTPLNGRTLFSKVKQLQPGCILTLETHRLKEYVINKYWTPEQNIDKSLTFSKASAHFGDVLKSQLPH